MRRKGMTFDRERLLLLLIESHEAARTPCVCLAMTLNEAIDPEDTLEAAIDRLWKCHYGIGGVDNA